MIVFISLFLLLSIFSFFICRKKWIVVLISLLFSLLIGFRDIAVGADTFRYAETYYSIGNHGYLGYPEPLFGYLNLLCFRLGCSFHFSQWVLSLIMMGLFGKTIIKCSPNYGYSFFVLFALFFVFYAMNIFRQLIAISIIFYAYSLLNEKRITGFVICVILATLCHTLSVLALAMLWLRRIDLRSPVFVLSCLLISFVIGFFIFNNSLFIRLMGSYGKYLTVGDNGLRVGQRVLQAAMLAVYWSVLFVCIYSLIKKEYRQNLWLKIYFFSILVTNLTFRAELGLRVVLLFSIAQVIVFPIFILHNRMEYKFVPIFLINTAMAIFFFIFLLNNSATVLPYKNMLFQ